MRIFKKFLNLFLKGKSLDIYKQKQNFIKAGFSLPGAVFALIISIYGAGLILKNIKQEQQEQLEQNKKLEQDIDHVDDIDIPSNIISDITEPIVKDPSFLEIFFREDVFFPVTITFIVVRLVYIGHIYFYNYYNTTLYSFLYKIIVKNYYYRKLKYLKYILTKFLYNKFYFIFKFFK